MAMINSINLHRVSEIRITRKTWEGDDPWTEVKVVGNDGTFEVVCFRADKDVDIEVIDAREEASD